MNSTQRITTAMAVAMMIAAAQFAHAQVPGGWSRVSTKNATVVAAALFAVEEESEQEPVELKKIVRARKQVVAGMNYEITLQVRSGKRKRNAVVVVWQKTDGSFELTSWNWVGAKK